MAIPNPEIRPIFMDKDKIICNDCENKEKSEHEEPCCSCKWITSNMSDSDFYKKKKSQ